MIRFRKPKEPKDFAGDVAEAIKTNENQPKPTFNSKLWSKFKPYLAEAQEYKCGFCEVKIAADRYKGDVEHYRPKGRVDVLEIKKGKRKQKSIWPTGYWWLAYSWDNYLLSCNRCNSAFKKNFFPIREERDPENPPGKGAEKNEHPLVMNPFSGADPTKSLEFNSFGQVSARPKSKLARSTIDVCGLDREELRDMRASTAEMTHSFVDRLDAAAQADEPVDLILRDIYRIGRIQSAHAGMVRSIFLQRTDHNWKWLVTQVAVFLSQNISKHVNAPGSSSSRDRDFEHMYDLGFERVRAVKTTFAEETGQSWGWLKEAVARIKSDRLKAEIDGDARLNSLRWLLFEIHRLGHSHAPARKIFENRTGLPWEWLEQEVKNLLK